MVDSHSEIQKAYINVCLVNAFENKYFSIIGGGFYMLLLTCGANSFCQVGSVDPAQVCVLGDQSPFQK